MRPASEAQRAYLMDLVRRLDEATTQAPEGIQDAVHALASAPGNMEISSADASRAIDAIVRGIARLGGRLSEREQNKLDGIQTRVIPRKQTSDADERRAKLRERADAFNSAARERYIAQHGIHARLDPPWRSTETMRVWQMSPDSMSGSGSNSVSRYWKWACRHPSHNAPVRGQTWRGHGAAAAGAQRHWDKFHAGS